MDLDPVLTTRTVRPWGQLIAWTMLLIIVMIGLIFNTWMMRRMWPPENHFDLIMEILFQIVLIFVVVLLVGVVRMLAIQVMGTRVVLDTDGVRALWGNRVLERIDFGRDVGCEVTLIDGTTDDVTGFDFAKGLRSVEFVGSPEDVARIWPVVEAAAWKHRMKLGDDIKRLLKE